MKKTINEKIAELRKARSLTQEALGEKLGVSGQAVSKWEKGESLPDILLLPELCDILGISTDALLEVPASAKNKNIMQNFCDFAKENCRSKTINEALAMVCDRDDKVELVHLAPDEIIVTSPDRFGFVVDNAEVMRSLLAPDSDDGEYYLRDIFDKKWLSVLACTSIDKIATIEEICERTGIEEEEVKRILFSMMERGFVCHEQDEQRIRGYIQHGNIAGIYMILAGCSTVFGRRSRTLSVLRNWDK